MKFEPHPLRDTVIGEMHARPYAALSAPRRVIHFAFLTDNELGARDRQAFAAWCARHGQRPPEANQRHHRIEVANGTLRWEQHAEFTTYSWGFTPDAATGNGSSFELPASSLAHFMDELPQPGPHLVSVDLIYLEQTKNENWQKHFDASSLAVSQTAENRAMIATDFRITSDGFVRYLVLGNALPPLRAGSLIVQLLELETYRTLCLLGLPVALQLQPTIRACEHELSEITAEIAEVKGIDANRKLLAQLTSLAGRIEASSSKTQYRFGASWAYHQIVRARSEELNEEPVEDWPTLSRFLERRIAPAIRTCGSIEDRQERLAGKLSRAADLLRTRVDIELEQQNGEMLAAMNARADQQLRLQKTVEGLSVAAISYYVAQLLFQLVAPLGLDAFAPEKSIKAGLVVVSVVTVALLLRRVRKMHE
jgi:uncharacterized membrane-anchored protein